VCCTKILQQLQSNEVCLVVLLILLSFTLVSLLRVGCARLPACLFCLCYSPMQSFCAALTAGVGNSTFTVGELFLVDNISLSMGVVADFVKAGGASSAFSFPMATAREKVLRVSAMQLQSFPCSCALTHRLHSVTLLHLTVLLTRPPAIPSAH
jgi:hypothetical protein